MTLGVVLQDTQSEVAQQGGFTGAGRGDDQTAGALANRTKQVDGAGGHTAVLEFRLELLVGRHAGERGELGPVLALLDGKTVHGLDELHLGVGETSLGGPGGASDATALAQLKTAYEFFGHEGVGRPALAVTGHVEKLAVAALLDVNVEDTIDLDYLLGWALDDGQRHRCGDRQHRSAGHGCREALHWR